MSPVCPALYSHNKHLFVKKSFLFKKIPMPLRRSWLIYFMSMLPFYTYWKHPMISRDIYQRKGTLVWWNGLINLNKRLYIKTKYSSMAFRIYIVYFTPLMRFHRPETVGFRFSDNFRKVPKYNIGWKYRSSHRRCSIRKAVLRNFAKIQLYLKRNSSTDVFLWSLQNL